MLPRLTILTFYFALALLAPTAFAQTGKEELAAIAALVGGLDARHASGSIQTAEAAESALQESHAAQTRLQEWYAQAERGCQEVFFVNACLSEIKLQRRQQQTVLRRITIEARALQRKLHIQQLDRALQQKQSHE